MMSRIFHILYFHFHLSMSDKIKVAGLMLDYIDDANFIKGLAKNDERGAISKYAKTKHMECGMCKFLKTNLNNTDINFYRIINHILYYADYKYYGFLIEKTINSHELRNTNLTNDEFCKMIDEVFDKRLFYIKKYLDNVIMIDYKKYEKNS